MVKRCCYGVCNTDSRYEDRLQDGVRFLPFPKKSNNLEKCLKWIKACGRPHSQFNVERITRATYICSKHFVNKNGPTEEYPDPIPFDGRTPKPARKVLTKRVIETPKAAPNRQVKRKLIYSETSEIQTTEITPDSNKENIPPDFNKENTVAIQTEGGWADPIDILSLTVQKEILERDLARKILDNEKLTLNNASRKSQKIFQVQQRERSIFSAENFTKDDKMLRYYSGFNNTEFNAVFKFLVPDSSNYPLKMSKNMKIKIKIKDQFFFTLCKLRNNLDFTDLGYRFQISTQDCSSLFCDWINFMYLRFGAVCTWPPRDMIIKNMPENYKRDFPNTLAIIDGTEIKIQKPSSLHAQSQSYSNYKSTNTLKALVAVDPRGSLLFTSCLFSGAISDKDIFEQSGLKKMLQNLVQHGHIKEGDGIMADKGFNIHKEVEDCKLKLNIPPFANAGLQMTQADALLTKKIAAHRVHVERTIGSVKKFKIVGQKVPLSLFGRVNQIWNVCCFLTTFQKPIIRRK